MLKVKQFLTRAVYVFKNRNGANEIIGSALLMVYTVLAVIPSIMGCAKTIDTAIQQLDNQLTFYLTSGLNSTGNTGNGNPGNGNQTTYSLNLTLNQTSTVVQPRQFYTGGAALPVPSGIPAGAQKGEVDLTFDYAFCDPANQNTVFVQGTKTVKYIFDLSSNSSDYEDYFDFSPEYFDVTGNFDPYMVYFDTGTQSYKLGYFFVIDNTLCNDLLKITPKSAYVVFNY